MFNKLLSFNSSRYRLERENKDFAKSMKRGSLILDAGCGDSPYKYLFDHVRYESADFAQSNRDYDNNITYICDLKKIPVKSRNFDYIICNQVLEHIPEPQKVINELSRVLKPGGKILFTAPLFYQEHEQPYDFYRYTQYGWRYLLNNSGLNIDRLDILEGLFGQCAYFFEYMYYNIPKNFSQIRNKNSWIIIPLLRLYRPLLAISAIVFHRLEKRVKVSSVVGPKNYVVIASKAKNGNKNLKLNNS